MSPEESYPKSLEDLKRRAASRAQQLGHRLLAFTTARHDPLCHVAFCANCRGMVIVSLEDVTSNSPGSLYGYALEARCAGAAETANKILGLAEAHSH